MTQGIESPHQNRATTPSPLTFSTIIPFTVNPKNNGTMAITNQKDFLDSLSSQGFEDLDDFRQAPISEAAIGNNARTEGPTAQQATERLFNIAKAFNNVFKV